MEGVPFDWKDYLSAEGFSDIVSPELGMHGDHAGQARTIDSFGDHPASRMIQSGNAAELPSTPKEAWHNQQFASQQNFYKADESQGYDIAGRNQVDREEDLLGAFNNDVMACQNHFRHHGNMTDLETSEAGFDGGPPQPVPSLTVRPTEIGRDDSTPSARDLETLVPDQVCFCAACTDDWETYQDLYRRVEAHPEANSSLLRCRITGCQWTTQDYTRSIGNNMQKLLWHVHDHHYGKPGHYRCQETGCKIVTKRWTDLKRHSSSKHCVKPKHFECPVLSCKYHQLGFSRKDKLKSHFDKVHKGNSQPGKSNQAIKPKGKDSA